MPYITEPGFDEALKRAVSELDIGGVYSPNAVVWGYLSRKLKEIAPSVALVNESPVGAELSGYRSARDWARARDILAPLAEQAMLGNVPSSDELLMAACRAYRLRRADVAPLIAWCHALTRD